MDGLYRFRLSVPGVDTFYLDLSPKMWDEKGYTFQEHERYGGVISAFTIAKLGFLRNRGSVKGGMDEILQGYDILGVESVTTLTIDYRNPKTNLYTNWSVCKLSWLNDPEQIDDENEDLIYMSVSDSSTQERFRENEELEVDIFQAKDLDGNSLTLDSGVTIPILRQNLYREIQAIDGDFNHVNYEFNNSSGVFSLAPEATVKLDTVQIGVPIFDGSEVKIFDNTDGEVTENITVKLTETRNIGGSILDHITLTPNFYEDGGQVVASFQAQITLTVNDGASGLTHHQFLLKNYSYDYAGSDTGQPVSKVNYEHLTDTEFTVSIPPGGWLEYNVDLVYIITSGIKIDSSHSVGFGINFQHDIEVLFDESSIASTDVDVVLAHEACENALKIITGASTPFYSTILGRTDLGYASDGDLGLVAFTMGWQLRQFPLSEKSIILSFAKIFQTLNAIHPIFMYWDGGNERFVLESKHDRYDPEIIETINYPTGFKRIFPEDLYFNRVLMGQSEKVDYEEYNGSQEVNTPTEFSTSIPVKNEYDIQSAYNLDPTGIETQRRLPYELTGTTDSRNDKNVYAIDLIRDGGTGFKPYVLVSGEETENILNGDTRLNLRWTPKRNFLRHGAFVSRIYHKNSGGVFQFLNTQMNTNLGTKLSGESVMVYEKDSVIVSELEDPYTLPERLVFNYKMSDDLVGALNENPNRQFKIITKKSTYYGYIDPTGVRSNAYDREGNFSLVVSNVEPTP